MALYQAAPDDERRALGPLVESSAQIQRTMVVGLGGTGGEVIKRLKRRLRRHGQVSSYIRFVSLDTDLRSGLASIQFPALEPRERVALHYPNPENVLESPHLYPTIQHLFHQGKRVDISLLADGTGAGLMPVVGRAAFHLNAGHVYNTLQRAIKDLQAIPAQPGGQPLTEEFRIYVVGSVAGGTGAGCILDAAVLIRHVFSQFKYQLIGILALPEAFVPTLRGQQLDAQSRGNAYAVLKELQYLQDGMTAWTDPDTYTFQYQLGGDVRTIILRERPFDIVYLVDNQNQQGGALRNLTDIYEMVSQQLSVEIGSPFGAKFASAQANERAIRGLAPCPETKRPANISSLATAALVVPEEKLLRYCTRRYLSEAVKGRLLGAAPPHNSAEQSAVAW
ncbi:MAG TPA: tubulin-like doman-containing protein, partial [Symbiobacteriaceae bacterium]|nr:tubulin-like doman-containing protein [Symbiobacteriaceae bacterium]